MPMNIINRERTDRKNYFVNLVALIVIAGASILDW